MVTLIGPQIGMKYEDAEMAINASYRVNAELFATHQNLNRVRQDFSVETDFSRMLSTVLPKGSTVHVSETLVYTPILPDFESLVNPSPDVTTGGVRTPRTNTLRNIFDIDESMPLSTISKIGFGYKNSYTQYQDPALVDSQTNEARMSYSRDLSRTDTATTGYSYRRFNPYGGEISHIHTLSLGDRHDFSPILTGDAGLGVIAAVLPDLNPQYSLYGSLSASRRFKDRIQMSIRGSRNIDASSGIASVPLITDKAALSLNKQFTAALSADTDLNVARNYSIGKERVTGRPIDIHSQGAGIGVRYQFTTWLLSDFEYHYYRQETSGNFQADLSRNQYSFTLRAKWS
ncbi:MAG: hypothetical protein HY283_10535 [Nitrospirae bacterium]|nr:hypothetical protein [Nitrospirota bacterium]